MYKKQKDTDLTVVSTNDTQTLTPTMKNALVKIVDEKISINQGITAREQSNRKNQILIIVKAKLGYHLIKTQIDDLKIENDNLYKTHHDEDIVDINKQIDALQNKKAKLEDVMYKKQDDNNKKAQGLRDKVSELGFDNSGNLKCKYDSKTGKYLPINSVAKALMDTNGEEIEIAKKACDLRAKLWLASNVGEARAIVDSINGNFLPSLPKLDMPAKKVKAKKKLK